MEKLQLLCMFGVHSRNGLERAALASPESRPWGGVFYAFLSREPLLLLSEDVPVGARVGGHACMPVPVSVPMSLMKLVSQFSVPCDW